MRRPLFAVCLCLVLIIAIRFRVLEGRTTSDIPEPENGSFVTVIGQVYQKSNQSFIIKFVSNVQNAVSSQQISSHYNNIICEIADASLMEDVGMGSRVVVQGVYYDFAKATNPGEFDGDAYYRSLQISGKIKNAQVIGKSLEYSWLSEALYRLRVHWREHLYQVFPQKEASVMTAMLLGDKEELDAGVKKLYRQNGIIHILSISGLHVSLIGMGIYKLLRKVGVPSLLAAILGGSVLILYGMLSGMSISACRAIGMYLIRMLANVLGRTYDALTALGVMAVILLLQNPGLLCNQGFLLSFGAIFGIAVLYPAMVPEDKKGIGQSAYASLSISLATLPIQLWFYFEVPVYSVLLNLLVLPFMGVVMAVGFIVMLFPGLELMGKVTIFILGGYEKLCQWCEKIPFHTWNPGRPRIWQIIAYYSVLLSVVAISYYHKNRNRKQDEAAKSSEDIKSSKAAKTIKGHRIIKLLRILPIVAVGIFVLQFPSENKVTFLDVGQGDGIVLEMSSGEVYLFDCGSSSRDKVGQYVLLPYLKYRGIHKLDAVFFSHADEDHINGIMELLESADEEEIQIGQLILPALAKENREEEFSELFSLVEKQENPIPIGYLKAGQFWQTKKTRFLCLHPPSNYSLGGNAGSECIYVQFGKEGCNGSLLLTGDVEAEGEEKLLEELQKYNIHQVSVLKVAHHGSRNSTSEELLEQLTPQAAVISCGKNHLYGHPHEETMERLEAVGSCIYRTDEMGAIMITIHSNGDGVDIERYAMR